VSGKISKKELHELKCIENEEMELIRQMSMREQEERDKALEAEEERMIAEAIAASKAEAEKTGAGGVGRGKHIMAGAADTVAQAPPSPEKQREIPPQ
jgi:hypothetical protein